jgi:hypothetical protein
LARREVDRVQVRVVDERRDGAFARPALVGVDPVHGPDQVRVDAMGQVAAVERVPVNVVAESRLVGRQDGEARQHRDADDEQSDATCSPGLPLRRPAAKKPPHGRERRPRRG